MTSSVWCEESSARWLVSLCNISPEAVRRRADSRQVLVVIVSAYIATINVVIAVYFRLSTSKMTWVLPRYCEIFFFCFWFWMGVVLVAGRCGRDSLSIKVLNFSFLWRCFEKRLENILRRGLSVPESTRLGSGSAMSYRLSTVLIWSFVAILILLFISFHALWM